MSAAERPVAIVTAIPEELEAVLTVARGVATASRAGGRELFRGSIGETPVVVVATGDGPRMAARATNLVCEAYAPRALVGVGVAGGLTPELRALDLLAGRLVRNGAGPTPAPDPTLLSRAVASGARPGTIVSVASPVVSPEEKRRLAGTLPGGEPVAVDMESAAWARAASSRGVPYLVVRAIADEVDEALPEYLAACVGADGGIRRSAVIARALGRPGSIGTLLRMRRRVLRCGDRLAAFLERFLGSGLEPEPLGTGAPFQFKL